MDRWLNKILLGDCLDVMREMPDKCVDLVLTDPPYGIGIDAGGFGRTKNIPHTKFDFTAQWDSTPPPEEVFKEMRRVSKNQIIFGGNYFINYLTPTPCYLIWDKRCGVIPERTYADCEMAWSSFEKPARIYRFIWDGFIQGDMQNKEKRIHPTQKPVALIEKIIQDYSKPGDIILDPFLGSGTTVAACINLERQYIGIEISPDYVLASQQRIKKATEQRRLFL